MKRGEALVLAALGSGARPPMSEISKGERRLLERLKALEDADAGGEQLTRFHPGGWWVESDRVSAVVCMRLLRHMLIAPDNDGGSDTETIYYHLDESVHRFLKDPQYVPPGVRLWRGEPGPFFD